MNYYCKTSKLTSKFGKFLNMAGYFWATNINSLNIFQLRFEHSIERVWSRAKNWGFSWFTLIFKHVLLELVAFIFIIYESTGWLSTFYPVFKAFLKSCMTPCAHPMLWDAALTDCRYTITSYGHYLLKLHKSSLSTDIPVICLLI